MYTSVRDTFAGEGVGTVYMLPSSVYLTAPAHVPTAFTEHFPVVHHAKYLLRGIYMQTPLRFKLGGRRVLSARFNVETAGSERNRPEI